MATGRTHRLRWRSRALLVIALAALVSALALASASGAAAPLSITVSGNHFVNGSGQTIRLLGVNHTSSEYACADGYAYNDGHMDDVDVAAIAAWNANAVRVPLNEDCWLGINGEPSTTQGEALTQAGYQQAIEAYVADLNAHGLYAILDLHWSAPGTVPAMGQQPMPDDHSADFWSSVAAQFKDNPAVVFDVFNEPYSPGDPRSGDDPAHPVSWSCWKDGGCAVPSYSDATQKTGQTYTAVGMQALVSAIRAAGARQPVLVGGLDYANDLTGWLANEPVDPLGQEAASFHNYMGKTCDNATCWTNQIAPVAASVPVVTGEFDEDDYAEPNCATTTPSTFDNDFMTWADANGVSYLAWGWIVLSQSEKDDAGCSAFYLIDDYAGTPAAPNGTLLHAHLLTLPAGGVSAAAGTTPTSTTSTSGAGKPITLKLSKIVVEPGGARIALTLRSAQRCTGTLSGQTVKLFAVTSGKHKRHKVSLGAVRFSLHANKAQLTVLKLSKAAATLLTASHTLRVQITVTLKSAGFATTTVRRTVTLTMPRKHKRAA